MADTFLKILLRSSVNSIPPAMRGWVKFIPGVAWFQRLLVNRVISGEPFVHTINGGPAAGLTFEVTLPLDKAIWTGTYETEFAWAIAGEVNKGDVCYDIGGYRGYMSGAMALAGASEVIVFEPLPANQNALRRIIELNPNLNIRLLPTSIGNVDGSMRLQVMADASMGKLTSSTFQAGAAPLGEIDVSVRRIDSLIAERAIPPPRLIKIDVEGAELDVLRGAAATLGDSRPLVFLEAHSATLEEACSRELSRHGYRVQRLETDPGGGEQTRHLVARADHG